MEDVKKFLWIIFCTFLIIGTIVNIKEAAVPLISIIILLPLYFWLDYKLNPHKYKKDS
ncbi:hypothetical protein [Campylobacter fetus]|uniref:hypothetical protein n=1 Tax=Campylobacter fetus TaxID=196 RepID=UPI0013DDE41C|nr:hypothetical protein [Campylobacter fetus]